MLHLFCIVESMVFRHISEDIKHRALWLLEHNYIPSDVAFILGVSERSMRRWVPPTLVFFSGCRTCVRSSNSKDASVFDCIGVAPTVFLLFPCVVSLVDTDR